MHDAHRLVGIMSLIVGTSLHPGGHLKERVLPIRLLYWPSMSRLIEGNGVVDPWAKVGMIRGVGNVTIVVVVVIMFYVSHS